MSQKKIKGKIFNIQRFSLHDGPGIRTTVFFKGCPLRCGWCCNPESQRTETDIFFYKRLCVSCGACVSACPKGAVSNETFEIDRERCVRCGECARACLLGAKEISGREMSVEEVVAEALPDKVFYKGSGGGVTLSGGEPAMQPEFAAELLRALREEGIQTAMETSAYGTAERLAGLAKLCDRVLFDLKTADIRKENLVPGLDVKSVLENFAAVADTGVPITLRYAVIPGFNDSMEDAAGVLAVAKSIPGLDINLLPFHRLADGKYSALGLVYGYGGYPPGSKEGLEDTLKLFSGAGIPASIEM